MTLVDVLETLHYSVYDIADGLVSSFDKQKLNWVKHDWKWWWWWRANWCYEHLRCTRL